MLTISFPRVLESYNIMSWKGHINFSESKPMAPHRTTQSSFPLLPVCIYYNVCGNNQNKEEKREKERK